MSSRHVQVWRFNLQYWKGAEQPFLDVLKDLQLCGLIPRSTNTVFACLSLNCSHEVGPAFEEVVRLLI